MVLNRVAWIGRLTGPKGDIAYRIITEVAPRFPQVQFTIVGGPVTAKYETAAGENVTLTGFVEQVEEVFASHDLVIGAGRVAIEAMQYGLPVIAVGENGYIGPVSDETIARAKATNFGDCSELEPIDMAALTADLRGLMEGGIALPLDRYASFLDDYKMDYIYPRVMDVYRQARVESYLQGFREIPILTYHRVLQVPPAGSLHNIYVTVDELEQQIRSLLKRGFDLVTFRDIAEGARPRRPAILTFDDGYEDNYINLLPLLEKYRAKAVIFALGDRKVINNSWDMAHGEVEASLMSDAQLLECHRSGLVEIGAHGLQHQHLPLLGEAELYQEVGGSKAVLEQLLGTEVLSFAYPYGDYGNREAEAVRASGYLFGIGTVNGPVGISDDLMRVRRITMFPGTKQFKFWHKTSGFYLRYCKLKGKDF